MYLPKQRYLYCFITILTILNNLVIGQIPDFSITGFATLKGGTIGGEGGMEVTVSSYEELKLYAEEEDTPYIIHIKDTITGIGSMVEQDYQGSISVASNKSLIGLDSTSFLNGVGLKIENDSNIIIKNLVLSFISLGDSTEDSGNIPNIYSTTGDEGRAQILVNGGDLICVTGTSKNIWIDHCELFNEDPLIQTNKDLYDGLIDINQQTGYITISWCYFHDHHKVQLVGSNKTDLYAERKITYHHNRYENVASRLPFFRGAEAHVFNNYYTDVTISAVDSRKGACIRAEKNYFYKVTNPIVSNPGDGFTQQIDNIEDNCFYTKDSPLDCELVVEYNYENFLTTNTGEVKNLVIACAGVGRISEQASKIDFPGRIRNIALYPNPSEGLVNIDLPVEMKSLVSIINILGQTAYQTTIYGSDQINLSDLKSGIYFIHIHNHSALFSYTLVLK